MGRTEPLKHCKYNHNKTNHNQYEYLLWDVENWSYLVRAYFRMLSVVIINEGISQQRGKYCMMTSSNGNIFVVTGPLCGNSLITGEFPAQRPVTRSFDVFFDVPLNNRSSKQSRCWWFETPSRSLWRHYNGNGRAAWTGFHHCRCRYECMNKRWCKIAPVIILGESLERISNSMYKSTGWCPLTVPILITVQV